MPVEWAQDCRGRCIGVGTGEQVRGDLVDQGLETENVAEELRFIASIVGDFAALVELKEHCWSEKPGRNSEHDHSSESTYHVNSSHPLWDRQVDFSRELVKVPYKTGHDLRQSWMRLRPRGSNDLVDEGLALFGRC